jgi:hypothetical protein
MGRRWWTIALGLWLVASACASAPAHGHGYRLKLTPRSSLGARGTQVQFELDGQPVSGQVAIGARSRLALAFSAPLRPWSLALSVNGQTLPADAMTWADDGMSAEIWPELVAPVSSLYHVVTLGVVTRLGVNAPDPLHVERVVTVPSQTPGASAQMPIEIVVENSGPARPQSGLQQADEVFEYISEYSISRMTAIYFGTVPGQVGPVRSCRMINPYLGFAYGGATMCSGVSTGTANWIYGGWGGSQPMEVLIEAFDRGGHFYRISSRAAPHNEYTSGDSAQRLRGEAPHVVGNYAVDTPHADLGQGTPADAPSVPLHGVTYTYDGAGGQYLRSDHGAPFTDQATGQQLRVKNVVLLHVPFHDAGWIEDENGGAHSVWYDLIGSGPAEVYSEGRLVHATWHLGTPGQNYWNNHTPLWLTDDAGAELQLDTGLTWFHVLGNGQ